MHSMQPHTTSFISMWGTVIFLWTISVNDLYWYSGGLVVVDYLQLHKVCLFVTLSPLISTSRLDKSRVQDETQQQKTHDNRHEMPPPCPPVALPSPSMGRSAAPTTHGVVASYGPMLGACGLVWQRHGWFLCLECRHIPHQKIEWWAWPWP